MTRRQRLWIGILMVVVAIFILDETLSLSFS